MSEQPSSDPKARPILFSAPMVTAILAGTKSQTRRVIKPQPEMSGDGRMTWGDRGECALDCFASVIADDSPYGVPGDRLWVRETWREFEYPTIGAKYDYRECALWRGDADKHRWRPSIFMPREACRIVLQITSVRAERLQEISEHDAKAEGVTPAVNGVPGEQWLPPKSYRTGFVRLWNEINGNWLDDPWVWVVDFRVRVAA